MARITNYNEFLTDIADSIRAKTGKTGKITPSNFDTEITGIGSTGSGEGYTGSFDTAGLKELGFTDAEIQWYNKNLVDWNAEDNKYHMVNHDLDRDDGFGTVNPVYLVLTQEMLETVGALSESDYNTGAYDINDNFLARVISRYNPELIHLPDLKYNNIAFSSTQALQGKDSNLNFALKAIPPYLDYAGFDLIETFTDTSIDKIPEGVDLSSTEFIEEAFSMCAKIKEMPHLNLPNLIGMSSPFAASGVEVFKGWDTPNLKIWSGLFEQCDRLRYVEYVDASGFDGTYQYDDGQSYMQIREEDPTSNESINGTISELSSLPHLSYFGGFKDLGKSFLPDFGEYNEAYTIYYPYTGGNSAGKSTFDNPETLERFVDSLYDLNLTYDVANGGTLYRQKIHIGADAYGNGIATDEIKQKAAAKGWDFEIEKLQQ